jgi:gamma-glutamyltranspeptidase / glutathione hydrolase
VLREPITVRYRDKEISSAGPPGGGLQVLLGMKILEHLDVNGAALSPDEWYARLASVIHAVFHDREQLSVGSSGRNAPSCASLLSESRVRSIAHGIGCPVAERQLVGAAEEPGETTHLCTADQQGNVVSLTQSIQSLFGAKVANGECGFLYNNYLTTCPRKPHPHQLGSRCLPRSNAAPTLVRRACQPNGQSANSDCSLPAPCVLTLGAAGSRRITSSILHVLSSVLDRGLSLDEALQVPRIHATLSRQVWLEREAASDTLVRRLESTFRKIVFKSPLSYSMGAVQAIGFLPDGMLVGAADPRREGTAIGY